MLSKKPRLELESCTEIQFDVKSLPNEVWCILFSFLDKKSLRNSTATCTHWFELIRNNSKFSGHICLPNDHLRTLKRKIDDSRWIWTRWPVLETLEFGKCFMGEKFRDFYKDEKYTPAKGKIMLKKAGNYLSQSISFKDSPRLDKIICFVTWHLTGIFPHLPKLPQSFGLVHALTINPKNVIESVGIEHVSHLELAIEDCGIIRMNRSIHTLILREDILQSMKMIGENGRNLKHLTISFLKVPTLMGSEIRRCLGDAFSDMFKGLKNFKSLQIVELNLPSMKYFEKYLDTFSNYSGAMVTRLNVMDRTWNCDGATLLEINRRFPNLTYLCCHAASISASEDLPKLVEDIFPDTTKVEDFFKSHNFFIMEKLPVSAEF